MLGVAADVTFGIDYKVEGAFTIEESHDLYNSGYDPKTITGNFSIVVKGGLWKLRWSQSNEEIDYQEVGTDGANLYTVRSVAGFVHHQEQVSGKHSANELTGRVDEGYLPNPGTSPVAPVLWWTFASASYLDTNSGPRFAPIWYPEILYSAALHTMGIELPAQVVRASSPPGLPHTVVFSDDGIKREWRNPNSALWLLPMEQSNRPKPFDKGFTNCILQVLSSTNWGGYEIPIQSEVRTFSPKPKAKVATDLECRCHYSVFVTNIVKAADEISTVPQVDSAIYTADWRFANLQPQVIGVGYLAKKWLSDDEVRRLPLYTNALGHMSDMRKQAISREATMAAPRRGGKWILFIFVALPALWWGLYMRSTSRNQMET
jgi:hypothetical protein